MTIKVYSGFSKRRNSTKQPTGGTQKTVTLKEGTSMENPTFLMNSSDFTITAVEAFDHYYFVDDIVSVRQNLIEIKCSMDVGATYKSDIGSYSGMIERSSRYFNAQIPDTCCAILNKENVLANGYTNPLVFDRTGFFVLSVLNHIGSGAGFTCYYVMGVSQIEYVAQYCINNWDSQSTDLIDWIQSTVLKTSESIVDCIWVPLNVTMATNTSWENIVIGVDDLGASHQAYRITGYSIGSGSIDVTIPHTYTDFRKGAPYSQGKLMLPGFGVVDFDPLEFKGDIIHILFDVDVCTGDVACYLQSDEGAGASPRYRTIASYTYNVAVPCPVGKVGQDVTGTTSGLLATAGGIAATIATHGTAASVATGIGAASSGINAISAAIVPTTSVRGGRGGRALANNGLDIQVVTIEKETIDPASYNDVAGRPFMTYGQISSYIDGYGRMDNADVPISGTMSDKEAVNALLNNGFYYE